MSVAQTFENRPADAAGRRALLDAAVERSAAGALAPGSLRASDSGSTGAPAPGAPAGQDPIPVSGPLSKLLPEGVRRGDAVAIESAGRAIDYLTLALLAGALDAGLWCGVVGVPELGAVALADLAGSIPAERDATDTRTSGTQAPDSRTPGTQPPSPQPPGTWTTSVQTPGADALDRLLLVPEPGERWAEIVAVLADGVDLVLVRPATAVTPAVGRRVDARLRQGRSVGTRHSAALLVLGPWGSARLVLRTAQTVWSGLDGVGVHAGTGHLAGGRATVVAEGRATGGRPRTVCLWLPAANGAIAPFSPASAAAPASASTTTPAPRALTSVAAA